METRMQRADPTAPTTPEQYRAAIERQDRVIAGLRQECDELRSDIQEMVKKAADNHLNGYRELGSRAAQAENERDELAARCERLAPLARRTVWLAYVWNDHNFGDAHKMARKEAEKAGINSFDEANQWLDETPAASLAHVRAEAIEEVAAIIDRRLDEDDEHPVVMLRGEAERIRQSAIQKGPKT